MTVDSNKNCCLPFAIIIPDSNSKLFAFTAANIPQKQVDLECQHSHQCLPVWINVSRTSPPLIIE